MALRENNAEGSAPGTTIAASQTGSGDAFDSVAFNGTGTAKYTDDTAMHGSQSYNFLTPAGSHSALAVFDGANDLSCAVRFYLRLVHRPSAVMQLLTVRNTAAGNVGGINLNVGPIILQLVNSAGAAVFSFSKPLTTGVWYRVEVSYTVDTTSTGLGTLAYYLGDSTTPVEAPGTVTTANFGTANVSGIRIGKTTTSSAAANFYMDDIAFNNGTSTFIGGYSPTGSSAWLGT